MKILFVHYTQFKLAFHGKHCIQFKYNTLIQKNLVLSASFLVWFGF